jgi:NTP pyrophosphatase (non-canonical NTP hydrolase)
MSIQFNILKQVKDERQRQDDKWGEQDHDDLRWLPILEEEMGEVAKALNEEDYAGLYKELVHVMAVSLAWLECAHRNHAARLSGELSPTVNRYVVDEVEYDTHKRTLTAREIIAFAELDPDKHSLVRIEGNHQTAIYWDRANTDLHWPADTPIDLSERPRFITQWMGATPN